MTGRGRPTTPAGATVRAGAGDTEPGATRKRGRHCAAGRHDACRDSTGEYGGCNCECHDEHGRWVWSNVVYTAIANGAHDRQALIADWGIPPHRVQGAVSRLVAEGLVVRAGCGRYEIAERYRDDRWRAGEAGTCRTTPADGERGGVPGRPPGPGRGQAPRLRTTRRPGGGDR